MEHQNYVSLAIKLAFHVANLVNVQNALEIELDLKQLLKNVNVLRNL